MATKNTNKKSKAPKIPKSTSENQAHEESGKLVETSADASSDAHVDASGADASNANASGADAGNANATNANASNANASNANASNANATNANASNANASNANASGADAGNANATNAETSPRAASGRSRETHTLAELVARYLDRMEQLAKSSTTIFAYKMELDGVLAELGAETKVEELTTNQVHYYFECPRVMRTKSGGLKAMPTILKSRRVLRQALAHGVELGWIEKAPIPAAFAVSAA